ncbi:MAG: hypothetical protein WC455_17360 [Dehalococcoidia bacterium]|jgi:hypothetical protein
MSVKDVHTDNLYSLTCEHKGPDGTTTLRNKDAHFVIAGVYVGQYIENDTDGSSGAVTAVTDTTVTCTLTGGSANTWTNGDTAYFYLTDEKDSFISSTDTDRSRGWKVVKGDVLDDDGWRPEDADLDRDDREVFGPGQPERR